MAKQNIILILLFIPLLINGCNEHENGINENRSLTEIEITVEANSTTGIYPPEVPGGKSISSNDYPPPIVTVPTLEKYEFKKPVSGTVTLHGYLIVQDPTVLLPAPDDAIYLVPLPDDTLGGVVIPSINTKNTVQADVDERTGEFYFVNVAPGKYIVVVLTVNGSEVPARIYDTSNLSLSVAEESIDKIIEIGILSL